MKKLFAKTDQSAQQYVGKVFTVGRFTVTVEDVIAEGKITDKCCNMNVCDNCSVLHTVMLTECHPIFPCIHCHSIVLHQSLLTYHYIYLALYLLLSLCSNMGNTSAQYIPIKISQLKDGVTNFV